MAPRFVKPGRAADPVGPLPGSSPTAPPVFGVAEPAPGRPAADGIFQPPPTVYGQGATFGPVEIIALLGLGIGWMVPGPGWLAGVVALVISQRWTAGEKTAAIVLPIILIAIPFIGFLNHVFSPGLDGAVTATTWFGVLLVVAVVVWPAAAVYLWVQALRRGAKAKAAAA